MKGKLGQWGIETIESNLILFVRTLVLELRCSGVFEAKQPSASPSKSPSNSPLKSSGVSPSRSLSGSPSKQSSQVLQYRWALEYHHGGIKRRVNEEMNAIKRSYSTARYRLVWSSHSKTWREKWSIKWKLSRWGIKIVESNLILFVRTLVLDLLRLSSSTFSHHLVDPCWIQRCYVMNRVVAVV
jgi:hypothetical protein